MKRYIGSMWAMEKKKRRLSRTKKNIANRMSYARIKSLSPEELREHKQLVLYFKLRNAFYKKEYVSHENLPEILKGQVGHFEDFIYPSDTHLVS